LKERSMFGRAFRLAFVVALVLSAQLRAGDNELSEAEKKAGWVLLFDGKSMEGWKVGEDAIPAENVKDGTFNPFKMGGGRKLYVAHYEAKKFGDFVLALDFKVSKECNSGVFFRMTDPKEPVQSGFEIQIFDSAGKTKVGKHDCGALYDAQEPSKNAARPAGEWQHMEITARQNRVQVELNGERVVDADLDRWTEAGKNPDGTKNKYKTAYKEMARRGYIGLQDHLSDCWFKNLKIRELGD
jgi:hypothetical protein